MVRGPVLGGPQAAGKLHSQPFNQKRLPHPRVVCQPTKPVAEGCGRNPCAAHALERRRFALRRRDLAWSCMARRAARWFWDHKRLVVGTSFAAAGAYTGYVLWQKKRELDALCEELMSTQGPLARNEESR